MARIFTQRAENQVNHLVDDVCREMCANCANRGNKAACREHQKETAFQIASGNLISLTCPARETENHRPR